jgi:uncharacterized protein (TIGR01777 family)
MSLVLITGASGLVGSALTRHLNQEGFAATPLLRTDTSATSKSLSWNPLTGEISLPKKAAIRAVVHLAGESIASSRWTAARKRKLWDSRIKPTKLLCESLAARDPSPSVLISASAVGYYGNRHSEELSEASSAGSGFLAELAEAWEEATLPALKSGIRVINLRIGVVLSKKGGALAKMLPAFNLGLGGPLSSGSQYMSWIALDDLLSIISFTINNEQMRGPLNATSPNPVTNAEFTKTLANTLHRPAIFPVPRFVLELLFGQMADEALLASQRVLPQKLLESGFQFKHPMLSDAISASLL